MGEQNGLSGAAGGANVVWDEKDFEDTISGDFDLGSQLIFDFAEQSDGLIKKIPDLIKNGDWEALRQIGHTLRGSAATISAMSISFHGEALNKAAHEEDKEKLAAEHKALAEELNKFRVKAEEWKKERGLEDELSYSHDFL